MINLVGQKFGKLIVIKRVNNDKRENTRWLCRCDCGEEKIMLSYNMQNGTTKSCGCLRKASNRVRNTKHGHSTKTKESKTYRTWANIIQRCNNPKNERYRYYGGRGIQVCRRWMKFENFLEDMGVVPKGYQIDRIDNNKGYCRSNCRWATKIEQMRNTRRNHLITHEGKTQLLIKLAEKYRIDRSTLFSRIYKLGWPIEKSLTAPVQKRRK